MAEQTDQPTPTIMRPDLIADPVGGYGRIREEAPLSEAVMPGGGPCWLLPRQADVRAVLSDTRFVNNPTSVPGGVVDDFRVKAMEMLGIPADLVRYFTDSILSYDGDDHTRLRKLVSRAFTVKRVNELRPRVEEITKTLLDDMAAQEGPVDLVAELAYPLPITVICELVGVPEVDRPDWHRWSMALMSMKKESAGGATREMVEYTLDLIARRRAAPADDLLSALIHAQESDGDRLSQDELVTMVFTLVIAGHETTAHLISNATLALLTHPDQVALLRERPDLWPGAVHELMRFCGPVLLAGGRYATEDLDIGGVPVHKGDMLQPVLVAANHDPREYTDPDGLDVTRRQAGRGEGHVGFGHGIHYCLGAALARQETEVALRALFERFPGLTLVTDEPEYDKVPSMRRLVRLPVRPA